MVKHENVYLYILNRDTREIYLHQVELYTFYDSFDDTTIMCWEKEGTPGYVEINAYDEWELFHHPLSSRYRNAIYCRERDDESAIKIFYDAEKDLYESCQTTIDSLRERIKKQEEIMKSLENCHIIETADKEE